MTLTLSVVPAPTRVAVDLPSRQYLKQFIQLHQNVLTEEYTSLSSDKSGYTWGNLHQEKGSISFF